MTALQWTLPLTAWIVAPLMLGIINRVKAFFAGRRGPSVWQLYNDLFKLLQKASVYSRSTSTVIRVGPSVVLACMVLSTMLLPWGTYQSYELPSITLGTGDVAARAYVRWFEIQKSVEFINDVTRALPAGSVMQEIPPMAQEHVAVALIEGWRGEICHVALTDAHRRLRHYKITDPSFHNWFGLALALRGQQISDFPLCNKSFNLSYCGHDL